MVLDNLVLNPTRDREGMVAGRVSERTHSRGSVLVLDPIWTSPARQTARRHHAGPALAFRVLGICSGGLTR